MDEEWMYIKVAALPQTTRQDITGSAGTKQDFVFVVKSRFPWWFGLQRGKRNIQKPQNFREQMLFLHVTFSFLEVKPFRKPTLHHKDKILLSYCRPQKSKKKLKKIC